jgi:hypothetical protein
LPNPSEKVKTRIPKALAISRCPASWTKMMTPRAKTKAAVLLRTFNILSK